MASLHSARSPRHPLILGITALVVVLLAAMTLRGSDSGGHELKLVFPAAPGIVKGLKVQVDGFDAGKVTDLEARDGQAVITVSLNDDYADVPEGTTARIEWKATLGERIIQLDPGPADAKALPDGAMVRGQDRVEIDQVLAALDTKTRARLASTLIALDSAVKDRGDDYNSTLEQLGPAVKALSAVLGGIGADGPAIKDVVTRTTRLMQILDAHGSDIRAAISNLDAQQSDLARNDTAISQALAELPSTLDRAQEALGKVPSTVEVAHPLLTELTSASRELPAFTRSVSPLLSDLNPTLRRTRTTVDHLSTLLGITPELLMSSTQLLPRIDSVTGRLLPALSYLRPYTPEITGFFTNWASAGQQYLGQYHVARIKAQEGTTTPIGVLNSPPPGVVRNDRPLPGSNVGQTWTDATGEQIR
ncbi:hypothetical protein GCM10022215_15000 [Nocardioides fonticola]|uniref:Mce/MlaD domain-containing protein n=2 Tax=Nocardioides fonticola TaxID=450363 RepID=A0ABP7XGM0_9ACTN